MNIPNKLTILRTCLIPVFLVFYLNPAIPYNNYIAAGIFIIASITDFFDGYLARKYNLITNFGKFLDPLADKLLVNLALLSFLTIQDNIVPAWVVFVIIARDFIINGFRLVASDNGIVIAADYWGKIKTFVQMVMVILVILNIDNDIVILATKILIYTAVALTIASLIDCFVSNRKVLSSGVVSKKTEERILVNKLREKQLTISFAESCTGGMLASTLINVPGSSDVIKQSVITYSNDSKTDILNVSTKTLELYTVVSEETAKEMALGAHKWSDSDIAISVTGIAGPDGGSDKFPVGLVFIGVYYNNEVSAYKYIFKGDRLSIRKQAVSEAIKLAVLSID